MKARKVIRKTYKKQQNYRNPSILVVTLNVNKLFNEHRLAE